MKPMPVRIYSVTDAKMLAVATHFNSKFATDHSAFFSFAPVDFPENFFTTFEKLIQRTLATAGDETIRLEQAKYTQRSADADQLVRLTFGKIRYFMEHHVKDERTLKQLGVGTFSKQVTNIDSLILFMTRFNPGVVQYKSGLINAGCPPILFDDLRIQTEQLIASRNAQTEYMNRRSELTEQRIVEMNHVWKIMTDITSADKIMAQMVENWKESYFLPYPAVADSTATNTNHSTNEIPSH